MVASENLAGSIPCKGTKAVIKRSEWPALKQKLWNETLFRSNYPAGVCFERSTLISFLLDQSGYQSEKMFYEEPILAIYERNSAYQGFRFDSHMVNVVSVQEDDGTTQKYALDPMFEDDLIPLETYTAKLSATRRQYPGGPLLKTKSLAVDQSGEPTFPSSGKYFSDDYTASGKACAYKRGTLYKAAQAIQASLGQPFNDVSKSTTFDDFGRTRRAYLEFAGYEPDPGTDYSSAQFQNDVLKLCNSLPEGLKEDCIKKFQAKVSSKTTSP